MHLILLPGNSVKNRVWISKVGQSLSELFDGTRILEYLHWDGKGGMIDLDAEAERVADLVSDLKEYVIFAKSAGVLLALKCVYEGRLEPSRGIFVGSAIGMGKRLGLDVSAWATACTFPTLWIQKTDDPAISFPRLREFVEKTEIENAVLKEMAGNDHEYAEINELNALVRDFMAGP